MSTSQILIFGEPLAGKSELLRVMRHIHSDALIKEMDEELAWVNGGEWPIGADYRQDNLVPYILDQIIAATDIIFFASYLPADEINRFRQAGFRIAILEISRDQWIKRDHSRFSRTHHTELSAWTLGHPDFVDGLQRDRLVDHYIDGEMTLDKIASAILSLRA